MRTREMGYADYGIQRDAAAEIKRLCKSCQFDDHERLLRAALRANRDIAPELYYGLVAGLSYEDLTRVRYIPLSKSDYYGWQRKCISLYMRDMAEKVQSEPAVQRKRMLQKVYIGQLTLTEATKHNGENGEC